MAVREIKTSITLDGEQAFRQAIAAANKELRVSQSELKAVASAYDLSGDRMTMLANKQRSLGDMVNQQENITNALRSNLKELEQAYERAGRGVEEYRNKLRQAEASGNQEEIDSATRALRQAEAAYERAGQKVADYRIQVNNAEDKLNKFKRSAQDVDREIEELGRDSVKAGRQIEDGIGDSAEAAEKDVRSLVNTLQDDLSSIRASSTFTAIGSLWDMATDAYSSVSGFVSGTQEYRKQLSFLQQNAESYDIDFSFIKEQLVETQTLTGDASAAVEGLSNLISTDMDTRQITDAVDLLAGAVIKFPDTLKFESLADGLQETIAQGSATGAFAELLGRLGIDVDEFNSALEESETTAGDIEIALAYLAEHGLKDVYDQWRATNEEMVGTLETQAEIEQELAEFGGTLEKYIVTPVQEKLLEALKWVNKEVDAWEADPDAYVDALPERILEGAKIDTTGMDPGEQKNKLEMRNAILEAGRKIVAGEVNWSGLGEELEEAVGAERRKEISNFSKSHGGKMTGSQWDRGNAAWIQATFAARDNLIPRDQWQTVLFNRATDAQMAAMDAVSNLMEGWVSPEKTEKAGEEAATSFMDGWDSIVMRPNLAQEAQSFMTDEEGNTITPIGVREDWEEYLKTITDMASDYEEAGEEAGAAAAKGLSSELEAGTDAAYTAGENVALSFGSGLASKISYVAAQASALAAAASARMQTVRGGVVQAVFNVDGRQMATALAPYNSEILAVEL